MAEKEAAAGGADKPAKKKRARPAGSLPRDQKKCRVSGCKRPYRAKGYCKTHYRLWRRGTIAKKPGVKAPRYRLCGKEDCKKPTFAGGLCQAHYDEVFKKQAAKPAEAAATPPEAPAAPAA